MRNPPACIGASMGKVKVGIATNVEINFARGRISFLDSITNVLYDDAVLVDCIRFGCSRVVSVKTGNQTIDFFTIPGEIGIMHDPENYPDAWIYPRNLSEFSLESWESLERLYVTDVMVLSVNGKEFDVSFESGDRLFPRVTCTGAMINGDSLFFIPKKHHYERTKLLMVYSFVPEQKRDILEQLDVSALVKSELLHRWKLTQEEDNCLSRAGLDDTTVNEESQCEEKPCDE